MLINRNSSSAKTPTILTIGGSDSSGLAGIQADNRVLNALNIHSCNVISAVTAQNNQQFISINPVSETIFKEQLHACQDFKINTIKVGLLTTKEQVQIIINNKNPGQFLIWDPVLKSTSNQNFLQSINIDTLKQLVSYTDLITPNIEEAEILCGKKINNNKDIIDAANQLLLMGAKAVLITGGIQNNSSTINTDCSDFFIVKNSFKNKSSISFWLSSPTINTKNTRGTGCCLASLCATAIEKGYFTEDAVVFAKSAMNSGLENSYSLINKTSTEEKGSINLTRQSINEKHLPSLIQPHQNELDINTLKATIVSPPCTLPSGNKKSLGLYPVVDSAQWVKRLIDTGVTTLQVRIKDKQGTALKNEIAECIRLATEADCRLFINDYWELAIELNAYGIHLGQEDLDNCDFDRIKKSGLRLGISSHCYYEVARALTLKPSYIACGPIYATDSKVMPWELIGLEFLSYWNTILSLPVVAIGGINAHNISDVINCNVDGIAMISAITRAEDPETQAQHFIKQVSQKSD